MLEETARIASIIRDADDILVITHESPDGDALGSLGATGHILAACGKRFALYDASGIPAPFAWMPFPTAVHSSLAELPFTPRLIISLDCGDARRAGHEVAPLLASTPVVNIDHHLGNPMFGTAANWVDPTMAATTQMVAEIARALDVPFAGPLGQCIYLGLVTDTGSFSFGNTTPAVLRLAAELLDAGVSVAAVTERHQNQWSLARTRLWGHLMLEVQLACNGTVAISVVPDALIATCEATREDLEGWAAQIRRIKGVRVGVLVRSQGPGKSKISLRSSGPDDVRKVAMLFGGGGHRNAAGTEMPFEPVEAAQKIVAALAEHLVLDDREASSYV